LLKKLPAYLARGLLSIALRMEVHMSRQKSAKIISVLMESPLYATLSAEEKSALVERLEESYPFLFAEEEGDQDVGYEASWRGMLR
jgi:hypothetical protein